MLRQQVSPVDDLLLKNPKSNADAKLHKISSVFSYTATKWGLFFCKLVFLSASQVSFIRAIYKEQRNKGRYQMSQSAQP